MHKISIIVPVYNVEKYLERCVNSILNQTYANTEIILVDDGSTDRSGSICDEFANNHNHVRVLHVKNGGPNKACYEGLQVSTGEYICLCDSDDWVDEEMLSEMYRCLTTDKKQIICCNFIIEDKNGAGKRGYHGAKPGIYEGERLKNEIVGELLGHENRKVSMSRCMKLFSRELLVHNTQFWDFKLRMGEDMTIVIPAVLDSERIVIMKDAEFYHYLFVASSIVHKYTSGLYENIKYLKKVLKDILIKKDAYVAEQCEKEYLYLLMLVLKNEARGDRKDGISRIKRICKNEDTAKKLSLYSIETKGMVEKGCKLVMRYPNFVMIGCLIAAIRTYDNIKR